MIRSWPLTVLIVDHQMTTATEFHEALGQSFDKAYGEEDRPWLRQMSPRLWARMPYEFPVCRGIVHQSLDPLERARVIERDTWVARSHRVVRFAKKLKQLREEANVS